MLRVNRGRIIGILLTGFIIYFLFLSSANTDTDFRRRTEEGLSKRHGIIQGDISDEAYRAQTNQKLNDILAQQQDGQRPMRASDEGTGPAQQQSESSKNDGNYGDETKAGKDETSVAGRKTMQKPKDKEKPRYPKQDSLKKLKDDGVSDSDNDRESEEKPKVPADPGKDFAREKLQEYLKKPIVIFSKTYCPHSKRAKQLLLEMYKITPTPLVVELDQLTERVPLPPKDDDEEKEEEQQATPAPTLGQKLQALLGEISGRRTVPNVMVGGATSIGGNDLIWEMHEEGTLKDKILELAGKRVTSIEIVGEEEEGGGKR